MRRRVIELTGVLAVLMQCFALTCLVSVLWLAVGYSLAFGGTDPFIGDFSRVFFVGMDFQGSIPENVFAIFQLMFAIITPALVVGAFAERMRFSAVLVFGALWSLAVYAPIAHWVWGGGWLAQLGLLDFAGGTVVHVAAGVAALVAAVMVGPRRGYPDEIAPPHNMTLAVAGAAMLWVGWLGFNGGSALAADANAAHALTATHMSAAAGAFSWMLIEWARYGKPSALGAITGMVAGLGTITPAAGYVAPAAALVIGMSAGTVCFFATQFMNLKLKIDDSLDVFAVHGVGGSIGTLLCGVFASSVLGGREEFAMLPQLRIQLIGVLAVVTYTATVTYLILKVTGLVVGNRVDPAHEDDGLDMALHDERGYSL